MDTLSIVVHMKTHDLFLCTCVDKDTSAHTQRSDVAEVEVQHAVNCKKVAIWSFGTDDILRARSSKKCVQQ